MLYQPAELMNTDEQQIRELVHQWLAASQAGDSAKVLTLMTEDVVFLLPGRPPMTKAEFAAASANQAKAEAPKIEGVSEIQEIQVIGDWAFMRTKLKVSVTPPGGAPPMVRAGHTLSILKKESGKWLLARDANLLSPVKSEP